DRTYAATQLPVGAENTIIIVQNVGAGSASVVTEYYEQNGSLIPGATDVRDNVPTGGKVTVAQATAAGLPQNWRGSAEVSATQAIVAVRVVDILDNSTGYKSYSIANATAVGAERVSAPQLFNEFNNTRFWNSRASVRNVGSETACVKVDFSLFGGGMVAGNGPGGSGCGAGQYPIVAGGQVTFGRSGTGVTQWPNGTLGEQMSAVFNVDNFNGNNGIAIIVDLYRSDGTRLLASYNGIVINPGAPATDDVDDIMIAPVAIKSASGFYTLVAIQNLTGQTFDVSFQYIGTVNGAPYQKTIVKTLIGGAGTHSVYEASPNDIPVGFSGYTRITANQDFAALVIRGKLTTANSGVNDPTYTAANAVPEGNAGTDFAGPHMFRRFRPAPGGFGFNSWIQVSVAGDGQANVTLRFVPDIAEAQANGCSQAVFQNQFVVDGSKFFYQNDNNGQINGFGASAPSCFTGAVEVTSNVPIFVIFNVNSDRYANSDNEALYDGFPLE
ncbi:MAG: hypothetical protein WEC33_04995, partial [Dehalococcoidia bacterium]